MTKRSSLFSAALLFLCAPTLVHAQSADLVLCDRLAADPADPDKPADVRGVADIGRSDIAIAIKFCRQAASSSRRAQYQLGRAYSANGQVAEATGIWRKAADKGSSSAMVELGVLYATGAGVAKDDAAAQRLFERAAQAGNPRGISNLAALGGSSSDPVRSRALLAKAAETNAEAQYQLGVMMAEGIGGPRDDVAARTMFERAAAQKHAAGLERYGEFLLTGRGGDKDTAAGKTNLEMAAALGNEDAKAALKRVNCSLTFKDKRGNKVGDLCF